MMHASAKIKRKPPETGKSRILIVDDDAVTRDILSDALESEGFAVGCAADGKMGLKLHVENPFDLVITDIIMPEMEGLETIQELRRATPDLKIIAISGGGQLDAGGYLAIAGKFGADLTFAKPLKIKTIIDGIKKLLRRKAG